jgi:hypothetical protein
MAYADDAKASAKATANNLIIVTLLLKSPKAGLLPLERISPHLGRRSLIWIKRPYNSSMMPAVGQKRS